MARPLYTTEEEQQVTSQPVLLIDKKGVLGIPLLERLREGFLTIYVSEEERIVAKNTVFIPFHRKVPKIPSNHFSHIIVVYNGEKMVHAMLPSLIKKAREDNAKMVFIAHKRYANGPFLKELRKRYTRIIVLLYGDVFGKRAYDRSLVTTLISDAVTKHALILPGNGLTPVYPIHFQDLILLILEVFFCKK